MSCSFRQRAAASGWWLRLIGWIVPRGSRAAWRHRRESSLRSLGVLDDRGELAGQSSALLVWICRDAAANALFVRWGAFDPWQWIRGPAFLIGSFSVVLLLLAACTHGFAVTRTLMEALRTGARSDQLVANSVPIVFAIITGAIAAAQKLSVVRYGWAWLSFLFVKALSVAVLLILFWIEGGAALRASIPNEPLRALGGGLIFAIAFIVAFDWAVVWSMADQQHRCPICLRRLIRPARIGTWASVFEPVATEWICEAGHGALCEHEIDPRRSDRWIKLEMEPDATPSAPAPAT
jgi:hypothetical protein